MNQEKAPAMPIWVKVLAVITVLLIVLLVGAHMMGMAGADMHTMHTNIEATQQP